MHLALGGHAQTRPVQAVEQGAQVGGGELLQPLLVEDRQDVALQMIELDLMCPHRPAGRPVRPRRVQGTLYHLG